MKKNRKKYLCLLLFVFLFFVILCYCSLVLEDDGCRWMKGKYYAGMSGCDIVTLGTSHVLYGIYPEVMNEAGVSRVYNLGGYAQRIPTSYWILRNAVDYGRPKPKIVILDLHCILFNDKYPSENLQFLHSSVDSLPFTPGKIKMINDIIPDHKKEFLFDLFVYHDRWNQLSIKDLEVLRYFLPGYHGLENGAVYNSEVKDEGTPVIIPGYMKEEPHGTGREYLDRIIDLCQKEDIKLMIINLPYNEGEEDQKVANWMEGYAKERGFLYYDMLKDDSIDIDYAADYCGAGHFNTTGAPKVSRALAEYLLDNCVDYFE